MLAAFVACREESEARNQRFNMVHITFAKKEAALRERADEAELMADHLRQVQPDLCMVVPHKVSVQRVKSVPHSQIP